MRYFVILISLFLGVLPGLYLSGVIFLNPNISDPIRLILGFSGDASLYFLLGIGIFTWILRWAKIIWKDFSSVAKIFGFYAFLYALIHTLIYIEFIQDGDLWSVINEIMRRIYLFIGLMGLLCLVVLEIFSKIFPKKFYQVSPLIYIAGLLSSLHYLEALKIPILSSYVIFIVFFILLCVKLLSKNKDKQ